MIRRTFLLVATASLIAVTSPALAQTDSRAPAVEQSATQVVADVTIRTRHQYIHGSPPVHAATSATARTQKILRGLRAVNSSGTHAELERPTWLAAR